MPRRPHRRLVPAAAALAFLGACGDAMTGVVPSPTASANALTATQETVRGVADAVLADLDAFDASEVLSGASFAVAPADAPALPAFSRAPSGVASVTATCTGPDAAGWFSCDASRENGLAVTRGWRFWSAGRPAPRFQPLATDSVNHRFTLAGTRALPDSSGGTARTLAANRARTANETVLRDVRDASGATTQRRWDGVGTRADTIVAVNARGRASFAATAADTVDGVRFGVPRAQFRWPLGGTITHAVRTVATFADGSTRTDTQRVVVTFDGTKLASALVGQLRCTVDLELRRVVSCQ